MVNKILKNLFNNWHIIVLIIFLLMLFYLHRFIYLYGDDYYYATFIRDEFWQKHITHYQYVNGRALVHFIVSIVLKYDIYLFRVINPLIIILLIIFLSKIVISNDKKNKYIIVVSIMLFSIIDINISRQSIYWLDGSFNYLFPILLNLFLFYYMKENIIRNKKIWWLFLLGFLASITTEQTSMISLGIIFLFILGAKFIYKKHISLNYIVIFLFSFLGTVSVILAPGNFKRIVFEENTVNLKTNILNLINLNILFKETIVYHLIIITCLIFWLINIIKKLKIIDINKKILYCIIIFLSLIQIYMLWLINNNYNNIYLIKESKILLILILISLFIYTVAWSIVIVYDVIVNRKLIMCISIIVAIGAQFMMLFSPVYGYRTTLCSLIMLFLIILNSFNKFLYCDKFWLYIIFVLTLYIKDDIITYSTLLMIGIYLLILFVNKFKKYSMKCVYILVFLIISYVSFNKNINGYKINAVIQDYNINKIIKYKEKKINRNSKIEEIVLKKIPLVKYAWSSPFESKYHLDVMKTYYYIDKDVKVKFIDSN